MKVIETEYRRTSTYKEKDWVIRRNENLIWVYDSKFQLHEIDEFIDFLQDIKIREYSKRSYTCKDCINPCRNECEVTRLIELRGYIICEDFKCDETEWITENM